MSAELLAGLDTEEACLDAVRSIWPLMEELYPICRSITGAGVRRTLALISALAPLEITEVPTGTRVFDWEVPLEWNVREAWIKGPAGNRLVDFRNHSLHLVSYSVPVKATLSRDDLIPHLHSLPDHPDWIPYRTSYYKEDWGFCVSHRVLESLGQGPFEVCIDSSLENGHLTYGECVIRGDSDEEMVMFTHVCHPSLCNDNLTGIAVATALARGLSAARPRLTYRFVFAPVTIGSITWLARNEPSLDRVRHGLILGLLGDRGPISYKRSRRGDAEIDRIAAYALSRLSSPIRFVDFTPYGYDERQLCSPGFNLPFGRLTRSSNGEYAEYHTSADDFSIIDPVALAQSMLACVNLIRIADRNGRYLNQNPKCEPRLGKRGLFRTTGGANPATFEHALLWVLNQSDGSRSLLDIAERSGLEFTTVLQAAQALERTGLLRRIVGVEEGALT